MSSSDGYLGQTFPLLAALLIKAMLGRSRSWTKCTNLSRSAHHDDRHSSRGTAVLWCAVKVSLQFPRHLHLHVVLCDCVLLHGGVWTGHVTLQKSHRASVQRRLRSTVTHGCERTL